MVRHFGCLLFARRLLLPLLPLLLLLLLLLPGLLSNSRIARTAAAASPSSSSSSSSQSSSSSGAAAAEYHERLRLQPLPAALLLASFNFRSREPAAALARHNYRLFPRSLGQILQHAGTRELHLRFALGRWDAASWGARPWGGAKEGGTGVELWAWVEADDEKE